jgi:hypothetical protein
MPREAVAEDEAFALLGESARSAGCPTCRVIARLLHDRVCRLQYDAANDPAVRRAVAAGGLCGDHLWYLYDLAGSETVAEILRPVLAGVGAEARTLGERIARDPELLRQGRAAITRPLAARRCVACASVETWEEAIVALRTAAAKRRAADRRGGPDRHAPAEAVARLAGGRGGGRAPR